MCRLSETAKRKIALYIHLPFCRRRCFYCDFNAYRDPGADVRRRYHEALLLDLRRSLAGENCVLRSVYIGGGTPSLWPAAWLAELLEECRRCAVWDSDIEISIEANPGTVSLESLSGMRAAGINRLSLGIQSLDDGLLAVLGRIHDRRTACESVRLAYKAGFVNVSVDLMYGLPGQTAEIMRGTVSEVLSWHPQHISAYALSVEDGTPLQKSLLNAQCQLPEEAEEEAIERVLREELSAAGYSHYEISNWCRQGYECRHNSVYWENGEYLGVGCGAVSFLRGLRFPRLRSFQSYAQEIEAGREPVLPGERLEPEERLRETMMLGLRTAKGLDLSELAHRFSVSEAMLWNLWRSIPSEFTDMCGHRVRLNQLGWDLSNELFVRYLM